MGFKKVSVEFHEGTVIARFIFKWKLTGKSSLAEVPLINLYWNGALVEDTRAFLYRRFENDFRLKVTFNHDLNEIKDQGR